MLTSSFQLLKDSNFPSSLTDGMVFLKPVIGDILKINIDYWLKDMASHNIVTVHL